MQSGSLFTKPVIAVAALVAATAAVSCEGCQDEEEEPAVADVVESSIDDDVVAVVRLADFEMRHFDIQHWWAEAVQEGKLTGRDDVPGGIAEKPTSRLRDFVGELFDDDAQRVDWEEGVDVALWGRDADGEDWRWAIGLVVGGADWLEGAPDWSGQGSYGLGDEERVVDVFARESGDDHTYFAAAVNDSTVVVSNFAAGGLHLGEAVALTGESGVEEAELYVWPRRLGLGARYRSVAERLEQKLARSGHNLSPLRSAIKQLQAMMVRGAGNDAAWPEVIRLWLEIDRDEETRGAERVELKVDAFTGDSALWSALGAAVQTGGVDTAAALPVDRSEDVRGRLQLTFDPEELLSFTHFHLPRLWRFGVHVGSPKEQEAFVQAFERMLGHHAGPTVMAFYGSRVPTGMTADMYVAWETTGDDAVMDQARGFHRRLMRDVWKPLFGADRFARRGETTLELGGGEVAAEQKTLQIGHGHGELGVCWAVRDEQFLSYYGVMPCDRLRDIVERSEETASFGSALSYAGDLRGLVETLYTAPGAPLERGIFSGIDVEVGAEWRSEDYLRLTAVFTDLAELAEVVDAAPALVARWDRDTMFRTDMPGDTLEVGITRFQEPGVTALGVPGFGGIFPPSLLLGIPFAHPPTMPSHYQMLFFANPDDEPHHHHHHHH